jgi:uncharacterized iron-regulated membrane protein
MKHKWQRRNRKIHYWGAVVCALPIIVVLISGLLLQVKKQSHWIQPPTLKGSLSIPTISMDQIFTAASLVEVAEINNWNDISKIDIRPSKGVVKVQSINRWEIQLDHSTGEILQAAYRRTDFIESLHDGSFFGDIAKLWVFLPAAIILTILWITGIYLFIITHLARRRSKLRRLAKAKTINSA